ncbi:MAG: TrkA family potassium uptake protein [Clostridiales bacterium]|nr:TrkA family potassium uptake protein [Clostridiales bacterium]
MALFKREKKENIIIVGCGRLGSSLAAMLSDQNINVSIIDTAEQAFRKLSPSYGGFTFEGDGMDADLLDFAGARNASALIACTNDDDANILIAQTAKQTFSIPQVIVRIKDNSKQAAYDGMGIQSICPATLSIQEFQRILSERGEGEAS